MYRLKRVIERKDKELLDAKDDTNKAEFTENLCKEEIKKIEAAFFDVGKEVLYASNAARINELKVKQTKVKNYSRLCENLERIKFYFV